MPFYGQPLSDWGLRELALIASVEQNHLDAQRTSADQAYSVDLWAQEPISVVAVYRCDGEG
jgi:hypothetical protein